jgi:hydrogenase-4 component E
MFDWSNAEFGERLVSLMAALVLVVQLGMVGHRWLISNIRLFGVQSFLLGAIAGAIAYFNDAPHLYVAAALTVVLKGFVQPLWLERLVEKVGIRKEIEPLVNVPTGLLISGGLTLVGYVVAESFTKQGGAGRGLGHNTLAAALALFLIGFFMMINRRKVISQVLALLTLENGVFLAAVSLTFGMPLVVEMGIFFDVLVAVMLLGILVYRIGATFESMDASKLRRLRG